MCNHNIFEVPLHRRSTFRAKLHLAYSNVTKRFDSVYSMSTNNWHHYSTNIQCPRITNTIIQQIHFIQCQVAYSSITQLVMRVKCFQCSSPLPLIFRCKIYVLRLLRIPYNFNKNYDQIFIASLYSIATKEIEELYLSSMLVALQIAFLPK